MDPSQDTLQAIKRFFPELRSISNDRILVSVPLDRSTTLPLVGPLPSAGMTRPTLIGVTEEAWPGVVASKPVEVRIDVSYTPEEVKERQCPLLPSLSVAAWQCLKSLKPTLVPPGSDYYVKNWKTFGCFAIAMFTVGGLIALVSSLLRN